MITLASPRFRPLRPTLALAALLAAAACSSSGTTSSTGSGGATTQATSSTGTTTGTGGAGSMCGDIPGGGTACSGAGYGGAGTSVPGGSVTALIVDESGAPVAGQPIFICGTDICSNPGKTGQDGKASISTTLSMKKPAFKFGDGIAYAELAIPLTKETTDFTTVGTHQIATAKLTDKPGAPLKPGADATSGDVTISIPAGAAISYNVIYTTCEGQLFRAVNIPLTNEGPVLDPVQVNGMSAGFSLLYGVTPAETTICPGAKVKVALPHKTMMPNDLGWAAGTAVEFWIMTTDTGQEFAPYGGWAKMSDGKVSADGASASTLDGKGFIFLQTFAIRKATP